MYSIKRISTVTYLSLFIFASVFTAQAAGEVDPAFNPGLITFDFLSTTASSERTSVRRVVIQPDGKIIAVGNFTTVNKSVRDGIVRFNADGTLDTTFNPPALTLPVNATFLNIFALALQPDGKILVGGDFATAGAVLRRGIMRLNANGSLDPSFDISTAGQGSPGIVRDIDVTADGKITIGGNFNVGQRRNIARFSSDGTIDASFSPQTPTANTTGAYDVLTQSDGKILVSFEFSPGDGTVYRLNVDGSVDFSINVRGVTDIVHRMAVQPDGKILIGGSFNTIDGFPAPRGLLRLNANGSVDTTFNITNNGAGGDVYDIELLPDGKILIGGGFQSYNGVSRQNIAIINSSDGSLDDSIVYTGRSLGVNDLAVQSDGKIVIAMPAAASEFQTILYPPIARLNTDTTFDSALDPFIANGGRANKVLVRPDGQILVGGIFTQADNTRHRSLTQFNADGTVDSSFTPAVDGLSASGQIQEIDLQPDGKILLAGTISLGVRLRADGTYERNFNNTPNPLNIKYSPTGKIFAITRDIQRFDLNGFSEGIQTSIDSNGLAYRVLFQPDNKIIIVGSFTRVSGINRKNIARLNADGTFDPTFEPPGSGPNLRVNNVALQADGKIIIAGQFTSVDSNTSFKYLARLYDNGALDMSFNPVVNGEVTALKAQPDGKILAAGTFTSVNGLSRPSMVRLNQDGTTDNTFNLGSGTDGPIKSIDLQADSRIIIGGDFRHVNGADRLGIARLLNSAAPQQKLFDYDGDGRADLSVFRPSTNRWYIFRSSDFTVTEQTFGASGDIITPADYDGDGKTDRAIFRPSTGDWWYTSSLNNAQIQNHWGQSGDIPRPGDFDGDGKADFVIFRPAENNWYRFGTTAGISIVNFGAAGDKPVTGDFDGDGKADVAIYRPSNGTWWYQSSINGAQLAVQFGISSDIPSPADYDGDGKTDFAVYRPSTGVWYIINSGNGSITIVQFGIAEDKPVAADYDGDGKADIAVFRPSTGVWYLLRSTAGFSASQFGISTDIPTEHAFVP